MHHPQFQLPSNLSKAIHVPLYMHSGQEEPLSLSIISSKSLTAEHTVVSVENVYTLNDNKAQSLSKCSNNDNIFQYVGQEMQI